MVSIKNASGILKHYESKTIEVCLPAHLNSIIDYSILLALSHFFPDGVKHQNKNKRHIIPIVTNTIYAPIICPPSFYAQSI